MPKNKSNQSTPELPFIITHKIPVLVLLAILIFTVSGIAWWQRVYNQPQRVFNGMISNSLSINSITRATITDSFGGKSEKVEQISLVPEAATRGWVSITQGEGNSETQVRTETIGTRTRDYSQYLAIRTGQTGADGKKLDYNSVVNQWGRSDPATGAAEYYQQSTLGLIPFANLSAPDQQLILEQLNDKKVYEVDYSKVEPKRIDGKSALVFPVKVTLKSYLEVFKAIAAKSGLGTYDNINPEDYQSAPPVSIAVTIDKLSRNLLELSYKDSPDQVEKFSGHGLRLPITLPEKTIPIEQLQQKIQSIQ